MLRTVWLGVVCLLCIGAMVVAKLTGASLAAAKVSDHGEISPAHFSATKDLTTVGSTLTKTEPDQPFAKSDRLAVVNADPTPLKTIAISGVASPQKPLHSESAIKIVSRHWRDPLLPKAPPVSKRLKSESLKRSSVR